MRRCIYYNTNSYVKMYIYICVCVSVIDKSVLLYVPTTKTYVSTCLSNIPMRNSKYAIYLNNVINILLKKKFDV